MKRDALLLFGNDRMLARFAMIRKLADERGLDTIAVKHGSGRVGSGTPSGITPLSLSDPTEAVAGVLALTADRRIAGGICLDELRIPMAALALSLLGLPGPGVRAATVSRNKFLQRVSCPAYSPRWRLATAGSLAVDRDIPFPCVVKPVSRQSSSGVALAADEAELAGQIASEGYPADEFILIEECVQGQEYSVESLVRDGQVLHAGVTRKFTTHPPYFVELSHTVPAIGLSGAHWAALTAANAAVITSIGVETALTHAEYRVTADGAVVLMEIAVRPPGDAISLLYQAAYGVSFDEQLLALALGEPPPVGKARRAAAQRYLIAPQSGAFVAMAIDWRYPPGSEPAFIETPAGLPWPVLPQLSATARPALRAVLAHKSPGDRLGPVRESDDRLASVVVDTPLEMDPDAFAREVLESVRVECR